MYFEYHRGVMTTQANHKRNMRNSEEQAINAEKLHRWRGSRASPTRR
jgi:alpha-mannosidase